MTSFNGWNRPALADIKSRVYTDLETNLPGKNANLRYSPLNAIGAAVVGQSHEQNGYIEYGLRQSTVLYCDNENLDLHGAIWSVPRQIPTMATGTITITGTNGTVIPTATVFQTSTGYQYQSTASATIAAGSATVSVKALAAGTIYNQPVGIVLSLVNSLAGANSTATVVLISGGTDVENDDQYRARILSRIATPPQGGCKSDYINWALSQSGVTRAWCYPLEGGNGTVTVRFMMDTVYPISAGSTAAGTNGIPTSTDVTNVANYLATVKPVTAVLTVAAPTPVPYNITVTGLLAADATTKANVTAEIANAIVRDGVPGGTIYISRIWAAISLATGETSFTSTTPSTNTVYTTGQVPVVGTVLFS